MSKVAKGTGESAGAIAPIVPNEPCRNWRRENTEAYPKKQRQPLLSYEKGRRVCIPLKKSG
nr:hypothetical protein [Oxynema aestuarii]